MSRPRPLSGTALLLLMALTSNIVQGAMPTDEKSLIHEGIVLQCIYVLQTDDVDWAYEIFQLLDDDQDLTRIIHDAYQPNAENIKILLSFLKKLTRTEDKDKGYELLFQYIEKPNYPIQRREGLLLLHYQCEQENIDKNNLKSTLTNNIKTSFLEVINVWASKVLKGDFKEIINCAVAHSVQVVKYLHLVMQKTYTLERFNDLTKFINSLDSTELQKLQVESYRCLIELMESQGHLYSQQGIKLAYKMKTDITKNTHLDQLKSKFPAGIQTIAFSECVLIKNNYNEYMYKSGWSYISTWQSGKSNHGSYIWKLTYSSEDESFTIFSVYKQKYAHFDRVGTSHDRGRTVFQENIVNDNVMKDKTDDYKWKLEPKLSDKFLIQNIKNGYYVYSGETFMNGRFIKINDKLITNNHYWKIEPVSCDISIY